MSYEPMYKICRECGTKYEYHNEEELKQFFYKKEMYFQNTCKFCERKKPCYHKRRPRKKDDLRYFDLYQFGNNNRSE